VSTIVSLTVTPMICAHYVRSLPSAIETRFDRIVEWVLSRLIRGYAASLRVLLEHRVLMLVVMAADDRGSRSSSTSRRRRFLPAGRYRSHFHRHARLADISYRAMVEQQQKVLDIVLADPAVSGVGSSVGGSAWSASVNQGRLFVALKPLAERDNVPTQRVIDRLRPKFAALPGIEVWMFSAQDVRVGGRQGRSQYQFTLWSSDLGRAVEMGAGRPSRSSKPCPTWSTFRPIASRAVSSSISRSTSGRRAARGAHSGSRCRAPPMPIRSVRFRPSTPRATSTR